MKICSLQNKHFLFRCVYSDILNRKFLPKKPFRLARNASRFRNCLNHFVAVVYFHYRLLWDFRTVFVEIKLPILLYYWITYFVIRGDEKLNSGSVFPSSECHCKNRWSKHNGIPPKGIPAVKLKLQNKNFCWKYFTLYTWQRKRHAFRARRNGFLGGKFSV